MKSQTGTMSLSFGDTYLPVFNGETETKLSDIETANQDRHRDSPRGDSAEPNGTANGKESNGDADHKGDEAGSGGGGSDGGGDEDGGDKDAPMSEAPAEEPPAVSAEA